MKSLLYFSIIAIVFCSCRSNAFLTQKYTHLKHTHNKTETAKLATKQKEEPKAVLSTDNDKYIDMSQESLVFATASALTEQYYGQAKVSKEKITLASKAGKTLASQGRNKTEQIATGKLTPAKVLKKKFQQAAGILGSIVGLILFIVIVVVLVVAVLLLILI